GGVAGGDQYQVGGRVGEVGGLDQLLGPPGLAHAEVGAGRLPGPGHPTGHHGGRHETQPEPHRPPGVADAPVGQPGGEAAGACVGTGCARHTSEARRCHRRRQWARPPDRGGLSPTAAARPGRDNDGMERLRAAAAARLRLLGWAGVLMLLSNAANIALAVVTVVGLTLVVVTVGIPLFGVGVWLTRRVTDLHRWIFASALGVRIPRPYRPLPEHPVRRLLALPRDPATWRDLLWLLLNSTVGFLAYALVIGLFVGALWYLAMPLLWWLLAETAGPQIAYLVLQTNFGVWAIDSQATAF